MENQEFYSDEENEAIAADPLIQKNHNKNEALNAVNENLDKNINQKFDNLLQ